MKAKLTDIGIRSYQPRAAQYSIGDAACPGLCIRITPKGVKTFAFAYRDKAHRQGRVAHHRPLPGRAAGQSARDRERRPQDRRRRRHAARAQGPARRG